ncbi:MAG: iron-sulfur cluster assembly protein [Bacteroidota bacterium]|nr:iron-sulfur cluster assembly protein [Bacteroidota bacterium]
METQTETLSEAEKKEKVIEAIKTVYDPEIPVNVFELGLIYEVNLYPVNNCYISMTLTSPSCPSAQELPNEVKTKTEALGLFNEVNVEITFDPPWNQDMMTEVAKLELGYL